MLRNLTSSTLPPNRADMAATEPVDNTRESIYAFDRKAPAVIRGIAQLTYQLHQTAEPNRLHIAAQESTLKMQKLKKESLMAKLAGRKAGGRDRTARTWCRRLFCGLFSFLSEVYGRIIQKSRVFFFSTRNNAQDLESRGQVSPGTSAATASTSASSSLASTFDSKYSDEDSRVEGGHVEEGVDQQAVREMRALDQPAAFLQQFRIQGRRASELRMGLPEPDLGEIVTEETPKIAKSCDELGADLKKLGEIVLKIGKGLSGQQQIIEANGKKIANNEKTLAALEIAVDAMENGAKSPISPPPPMLEAKKKVMVELIRAERLSPVRQTESGLLQMIYPQDTGERPSGATQSTSNEAKTASTAPSSSTASTAPSSTMASTARSGSNNQSGSESDNGRSSAGSDSASSIVSSVAVSDRSLDRSLDRSFECDVHQGISMPTLDEMILPGHPNAEFVRLEDSGRTLEDVRRRELVLVFVKRVKEKDNHWHQGVFYRNGGRGKCRAKIAYPSQRGEDRLVNRHGGGNVLSCTHGCSTVYLLRDPIIYGARHHVEEHDEDEE